MFNFKKKNKASDSQLWVKFKDRKNTTDVLVEKGKILAPFAIDLMGNNTNLLFQQIKKDQRSRNTEGKSGEVFFEIVLFYTHFIDRQAFQFLNQEQRYIFMYAFIEESRSLLNQTFYKDTEEEEFQNYYNSLWEQRQIEYGQYKSIMAENDQGFAGTLFWEFGKKIAKILDSENDIVIIMYVQTILGAVTILQIPELLKE